MEKRIVTFTKEHVEKVYHTTKDSWSIVIRLLGIQENPDNVNEVTINMNNINDFSYK